MRIRRWHEILVRAILLSHIFVYVREPHPALHAIQHTEFVAPSDLTISVTHIFAGGELFVVPLPKKRGVVRSLLIKRRCKPDLHEQHAYK